MLEPGVGCDIFLLCLEWELKMPCPFRQSARSQRITSLADLGLPGISQIKWQEIPVVGKRFSLTYRPRIARR